MSIFYNSQRIGKGGKPFLMYKFRTLKAGSDKTSFASADRYVPGGRFMRKFRIDELPQLWNMLRSDMSLFGPRPEEGRTLDLLPPDIRQKLLSIKPGLFGLSGIYFMDEETLLQASQDPHKDYWEKIRPIKMALDFFYIDNRCFLLNLAIIYMAIKARLWTTH